MANIMDAIKAYFEERNRIWVTGDIRPLQLLMRSPSHAEWFRGFRRQLAAKRHEMSVRGGRLLRSHSQIQVHELEKSEDGTEVQITLDERVNWVYRDGADFSVEARVIEHRQRWEQVGTQWVLVEDAESGEEYSGHSGPSKRDKRFFTPRTLNAPARMGDKYNRVRALRYAELWWDGYNPSFTRFESDDCTNFISQCLLSGNMRMTDGGDRSVGWWYKFGSKGQESNWSYSWSTANSLMLWLTNRMGAQVLQTPRDLKIGDIIFYDWKGNGKFGHSTMVVDFNAVGDPLVNAHTDASYHRHYLYLDSRAWSPNTRYAFVHIPDDLG